jgi:hypothetical protein
VLSGIPLVDHHAHGVLRAPPESIDEFRGLFSESPDPRQWPHIASGVTYRRAIAAIAAHVRCEPNEQAVYEHRLRADPAEYAASFLRATNTELLLLDDGYPPTDVGTAWDEFAAMVDVPARPVLRLESHSLEDAAAARETGFVALKATERTGDPLPVQVHCGFGDSDLHLWRADPSYLKPIVERFRDTTFVLLHCYPFVREAGWMAHVYGNVYFDLSLTIPHVSRPRVALEQALELAPVSKLLYASDAARTPELYLLAATWWRDALADVLDDERDARLILRENALRVYAF